MDLENLPPSLQFVFISMLQSAIHFKEMKREKDFFVNFASEIWETMEMSDIQYLKDVIQGKMKKDLEPYVKSYMEKNGMDQC